VDQKEIQGNPGSSLTEVLSTHTGVTYTDDLGQGLGARLDLRGFGGEAKQSLVLFDGVRAVEPFDNSTTWSLYPKEYLRSVEIHQGASSPLYGEGALSGAIQLSTKQPTKDWRVAGESAWGSYGLQRYFTETSGTTKGGLGMYLGGRYIETDGYRQNSFHEGTSALIKTEGNLNELISLQNTFYFADHETGIPGPLLPQEVLADRRQRDPDGQFGDKFTDGLIQDSVRVDYWAEPIDVQFSNLTAYRLRDQDSIQSFGGAFPGTSINAIGTETYSNVIQASKEWVSGGLGQRSVIGVEWEIDDIHNPFTFDDKTFGPFSSERSIDRRMLGYFAQHKAELWEKFILDVGVRYDDIDWNIYDLLSPRLEKKKKSTHLSPSIGFEVKATPEAAIFMSFSEAFKAPDANTLIFETPNIFTPNPAINSSVARHNELGVRIKQADQGQLKIAGYLIETKKEILFNDITNTNENFDTQRQGIEVSEDWVFSEYFRGVLRYTYADPEFDNGAFDGRKIPLVPETQWTAGVTLTPNKEWAIGLMANAIYDRYALNDFNNIFPVEDYWTAGLSVSYHHDQWELFIKAENIFGEEYSTFTTSDGQSVLNLNPAPEENFEFGLRIAL
jgi:iron complex outermembrane receptor protein